MNFGLHLAILCYKKSTMHFMLFVVPLPVYITFKHLNRYITAVDFGSLNKLCTICILFVCENDIRLWCTSQHFTPTVKCMLFVCNCQLSICFVERSASVSIRIFTCITNSYTQRTHTPSHVLLCIVRLVSACSV